MSATRRGDVRDHLRDVAKAANGLRIGIVSLAKVVSERTVDSPTAISRNLTRLPIAACSTPASMTKGC